MKRRVVHCAFAAAAVVSGALAVWQGALLQRSERVNAAIADARPSQFDADVPEARFARALALARTGEYEAAQKEYKLLIRSEHVHLKRRALYNLGNLYLRDALEHRTQEAFRSLPLVELAKQSYRDLLRVDPADWDARYNLERALRLAPEFEQEIAEEEDPPQQEESMSTLQGARIDLP